ncbi:STAS domain-containing protein [Streptomyces sp. YC537]|uniref:STAS domain-containing protein n=1 Tax=Streptomyces boluensis TaxID=1775135 RepID=A0A964UUJ0_9ACTN|nr:STAS domain-containing protein [Streptomyces boluensis]
MNAKGPIVVALGDRVDRADVPRLCEQARNGLEHTGATELICDAGALAEPGLAAVEALARLRLTARRAGASLRIRDPGAGLRQLLLLVGLVEMLGEAAEVIGEPEMLGEPEHREPALGVQEGVEPDDLAPGDLNDLQRPR